MKFNKPGKKVKHSKTKAESEHLSWVASQGCIICGRPACVHHVRQVGSKRNHYDTIPLCHFHHQGAEGVHTLGKKAWSEKYGSEQDLLKKFLHNLPF